MSLQNACRFVVVAAVLSTSLSACAVAQPRRGSRVTVADCARHIAAAHAALAAPPESGIPGGHAYAVAMHEYHTCLAGASAAPLATR